jgi:L-ascorbate metabolism protein UlaG (beta-lactamase superfamily)
MRISKYGHSCLHVVDGDASILIDPGVFSQVFETLSGLTAVLVTHQHPDHVDPQRLTGLLRANPAATLYADSGSVAVLAEAGINATPVATGDVLDVGTRVEAFATDHAVIHRDVPVITNACYLIGGRLLHPGDSLTVLDRPVEILALPTSAPWMALKEAVDYFRAVDPQVAIPIHEKVMANPAMVYGLLAKLGPAGARWVDLDNGRSETF